MQAAQVEEEVAVVALARLDQRTDTLQIGQDGFEHRRRSHRVRLQDDRPGTEWYDLAQWQTRPDARCLGLWRAQLDNFAFARRAAEH